MKNRFFNWILHKFLKSGNIKNAAVRAEYGRFEGWTSILVNGLLFVSKLIVGLHINSIALVADSIHSLSDVATSVIVIAAYKISGKPADIKHPYGHQRAEYIATVVISILLAVAGFEFIKGSIHRLSEPQIIHASYPVLIFIVVTVLIKVLLGLFSSHIGHLINSQALHADSLHHYTDALSSVLVLVAVWGSSLGFPALDSIGGILVGVILFWVGFLIAKKAADPLLGKPPSYQLIRRIQKICRLIDDVVNIHDIVVHSYGNEKFISVHVEVDQKRTSVNAHLIADSVEKALKKELNAYSTVHVDPIDIDSPEVKRAADILGKLVPQRDDIKEFHELRFVERLGQSFIFFDLVPETSYYKKKMEPECKNWFVSELKKYYPDREIVVNIDPIYTHN